MSRRTSREPHPRALSFQDIGLPIGLVGLLLVLSSGVLDQPVATRGPSAGAGAASVSDPNPPSVIKATLGDVERTVAPAGVPIRVRSDFAGALNGWTFGGGEAISRIEHRLEAGSDGGRGFLRFHDGDGGLAAYLRMPSVHLGDQGDLYGGEIRLSLRIARGGGWIGSRSPLLRITGASGGTMTYRHGAAPGRGGWSEIVVPVRPDGWEIDGAPASEAGMRAILADVATAELRIEQCHGSDEVIDLDSVEFVGNYGLASLTN